MLGKLVGLAAPYEGASDWRLELLNAIPNDIGSSGARQFPKLDKRILKPTGRWRFEVHANEEDSFGLFCGCFDQCFQFVFGRGSKPSINLGGRKSLNLTTVTKREGPDDSSYYDQPPITSD